MKRLANLKINSKVISKLNPCKDRFDNFKKHYPKFNEDILVFLNLEHITFSDKLWVAFKLLPRELIETFAVDCAIKAQEHAAAADYADYAAYAAAAATYAAYAAYAAAADYASEKSRNDSLDALAYLIINHEEGES